MECTDFAWIEFSIGFIAGISFVSSVVYAIYFAYKVMGDE